MMTQNEAPEQPNEDPTYERYQSSEQKGKKSIWYDLIISRGKNLRWSKIIADVKSI